MDPKLYAVKLAEGCEHVAREGDIATLSPVQVMQGGFTNAFNTLGSATACVAVIRDDGTLLTANVGDSGCTPNTNTILLMLGFFFLSFLHECLNAN